MRVSRKGCFALGAFAGFIAALIVGIALLNCMRPDVYHYKGEGEIEVIGTSIITPGYTIEFKPFDLGKRAEMKFDVSGLPRNRLQWPLFAVNILSSEIVNFDADSFTGTLHLRLTHHDGPVLFDIAAPIDKWIAHEANTGRGGVYKYELYFMSANAGIEQSTSVNPKLIARDAHLTFEVEYEPGERPISGIGIPAIRTGGYM